VECKTYHYLLCHPEVYYSKSTKSPAKAVQVGNNKAFMSTFCNNFVGMIKLLKIIEKIKLQQSG
jgi:hypothetical protein